MTIRRTMQNNPNTQKDISLSVDTDEHGKITNWEMTLTRSQAIDLLEKVLYKAIVQCDVKTARVAYEILIHLTTNSKTDSKNIQK
jgi:hypothetical protein